MNEETVKNSIIMPYFKSLGFDAAEIEYETTFSIKLGKNAYSIDGPKQRAAGRLDILFKRNGENLFVVETKSQEHPIDDADRTQAISYARLLDKIAPFAIVTNGIETEIYDVITNKRLSNDNLKDSNYVVNGYKVTLKPELRYQALKNFIGLNVDNLRAFCQKQVASNMQGIIGNEQVKEGKFIRNIFLKREGIKNVFDSFLISDKKVFAIVAESGFGKTNAICDLAIEYSQTNPTLFFNGSQVAGDFLEDISYEFNWDFGGDQGSIDVIKRMSETLIQFDKDLIIFIDAVDEFPNTNSKIFLDTFIKRCPTRIKLCISCKETVWPDFLTISGIRSSISNTLFVNEEKDKFSFNLMPFSNSELDGAIQKYQEFFKLPGIEGSTKALCSNPLMLRALSEVYSAKSFIPDNLITATVTKTFLDKKFEKSTNADVDRNFLSSFGKFLFEENKEMVFEDEIPEHLNVPDFLIDYNLLRRTKDHLGRSLVGFQYDNIRDFVICFFSLKLDKLSESDLVVVVKRNIQGDIPRNVFYYYERIAESNNGNIIRKEFSQYHSKRAKEFEEAYQQILDTEFPVIRELFEPYSKNVGLLVFYSLNYLHPQYSFREIKDGEPKVIWLEKESWHDKTLKTEIREISLKYKIRRRISASLDFTIKEPSKYARECI
ncbi:type I restriction enzyme HsdR N-terminal domain-containing protein, partial [Candidatus Bathyarchaeota archaeon]|nr:type I restriction enzyme HsdR N-terminal domain-containing protein [Candidatus Bathyarchaeota archaeon]